MTKNSKNKTKPSRDYDVMNMVLYTKPGAMKNHKKWNRKSKRSKKQKFMMNSDGWE